MDKDKSGPAFPFTCQGPTTGPEFYYGLTKREKFAETALLGILSGGQDNIDGRGDIERHSRIAVLYADGLLKELEKNG